MIINTMKDKGYAIGEMSRKTGVNIETIRYYERTNLLPKPDRTRGGNRQYNYEQLKRLKFVRRSRDLGFSIAKIKALLEMVDGVDLTCGEVHDMTIFHLSNVKNKIDDLRQLEKTLKKIAAECSKGDLPDCPIIDTLFAD
jgi:MerR family mercuric resistance operon transcriptional regulator